MNKYLEKYIPKLSFVVLFPIELIVFFLSLSIITTIKLFIIKSTLISIFLLMLLFILMYFLANSLATFRKKQAEWLKNNGVKISTHFNKLGSSNVFYHGRDMRNLYVEGIYLGIKQIFKSDTIDSYYIGGAVARNMLTNRIKDRGENIDVWISPLNSKVYWVDTDFLK